jgi:hypothetical protein
MDAVSQVSEECMEEEGFLCSMRTGVSAGKTQGLWSLTTGVRPSRGMFACVCGTERWLWVAFLVGLCGELGVGDSEFQMENKGRTHRHF